MPVIERDWKTAYRRGVARRPMATLQGYACRGLERLGTRTLSASEDAGREQSASLAFLTGQRELFESNPATKKDAERLAWASFCHVLLNTNELIYVD